jgi:hypothetical protein
METTTQETQNNGTKVIADIPRSENDVYRIACKEYKDRHFVDVRIFFRDREDRNRLIPTNKGICLDEARREEVIAGMIRARQADLGEKTDGEAVQSVVICDIPVSETEVCRISKGSGSKNTFVDVRRFFKKNGEYVPYKRKGLSINVASLDDVITGLMEIESPHAS